MHVTQDVINGQLLNGALPFVLLLYYTFRPLFRWDHQNLNGFKRRQLLKSPINMQNHRKKCVFPLSLSSVRHRLITAWLLYGDDARSAGTVFTAEPCWARVKSGLRAGRRRHGMASWTFDSIVANSILLSILFLLLNWIGHTLSTNDSSQSNFETLMIRAGKLLRSRL